MLFLSGVNSSSVSPFPLDRECMQKVELKIISNGASIASVSPIPTDRECMQKSGVENHPKTDLFLQLRGRFRDYLPHQCRFARLEYLPPNPNES